MLMNKIFEIGFLTVNTNSYSDWILVLIALLTLYVAWLARKEFLKNQAKTKQIEIMSLLISELNTVKIGIEAWSFKDDLSAAGRGWSVKYNIFEIANLYTTEEVDFRGNKINFSNYDDQPVIFDEKSNQIANIKDFIDHPFLPKKIADELINFFSFNCEAICRQSLCGKNAEVMILTSGIFEAEKRPRNEITGRFFINSDAIICSSWLNLKAHSNNLMEVIIKWFKQNGIDDVNLRIDYKN